MDPNQALINARVALLRLREVLADEDPPEPGSELAHAADLADAFEALDGWLSKGGFLPESWRQP